jgi:hypothetical protein
MASDCALGSLTSQGVGQEPAAPRRRNEAVSDILQVYTLEETDFKILSPLMLEETL